MKDHDKLLEACRDLMRHLRKSDEPRGPVGHGSAAWLRHQADEMENLDAAIDRFRKVMEAYDSDEDAA